MSRRMRPLARIDLGEREIAPEGVYVIAEMACAHNGDFGKAQALVEVAATAGVDAVQLQFFSPPANVVEHHRLRPVLENIEFDAGQWEKLVQSSRERALQVFVCAYDMPSLELALRLGVDGIKFNSADLGNSEMLIRCAESGTAFTLGTGGSRMEEIGFALSTVLAHGGDRVVLMHGLQSFPTRIDKASIRRIAQLRDCFGALVGYADHTDGDDPFCEVVDLLALGAGACVLEKHFTLERAAKGLDYQAALNPDQLRAYVQRARLATRALGTGWPLPFDEDDLRYRQFQKKRIVATRDLAAGTVLGREHLALLRTEDGEGLDASALASVIGRTVAHAIGRNGLVRLEDLA